MCWRGRSVYKRRQIEKILSTTAIVLGVLLFMLVVDGLAFLGMKYVFHLNLRRTIGRWMRSDSFGSGMVGAERFT